jgi:hypothetical protein
MSGAEYHRPRSGGAICHTAWAPTVRYGSSVSKLVSLTVLALPRFGGALHLVEAEGSPAGASPTGISISTREGGTARRR